MIIHIVRNVFLGMEFCMDIVEILVGFVVMVGIVLHAHLQIILFVLHVIQAFIFQVILVILAQARYLIVDIVIVALIV